MVLESQFNINTGQKIKWLRARCGVTQSELSDMTSMEGLEVIPDATEKDVAINKLLEKLRHPACSTNFDNALTKLVEVGPIGVLLGRQGQ